jgi:hypothetical protein
MLSKNKKIDVIEKLLALCYEHNKDALFIMSLMHQYEERGSLSKKQLQGLLLKAQKIKEIPAHQIAAVEAIVLKMPTRDKTPVQKTTPAISEAEAQIAAALAQTEQILAVYASHKQVLLLRSKLMSHQSLTPQEQADLNKFVKILIKK